MAWDEVESAIEAAPYPIEVLTRTASVLDQIDGVTERSWMGAVVDRTGGLLVDHGWLRVFGSGDATRGLPDILTAQSGFGELPGFAVAVDVLGGVFAWAPKTMLYFAPDSLRWEDVDDGYGSWLNAMLRGAMDRFYEDVRWPGWTEDVAAIGLDQGIHTAPPLFTREGKDVAAVSRRPVSLAELISVHRDMARQLDGA